MIGGLDGAQAVFNTAFIVVLASLVLQGWTIGPVARLLGLTVPAPHGPLERIELELPGRGDHEIVTYVVHPESPVARGQRIPRWARPALIVRDGRSLRSDRAGPPQPGDHIYVLTTANNIRLLDGLFAGPAQGAGDPELYGEFAITPDTRLTALAETYDTPVEAGDADMTVGELLRRELAGDIEQGDRIAYGPIDLIVRAVDDAHAIVEVGLALEHARRTKPRTPAARRLGAIASTVGRLRKGTGGRAMINKSDGPSATDDPPE